MNRSFFKSALMGSVLALTTLLAPLAHAQLNHGISAIVNDDIITDHDLRQRILFILATTGAERTQENLARIQQQALRNLIDEKIQIQESEKYEQNISPEEIDQSVLRLIGRNGLDPNEVIAALSSVGASIDTLRGQVKSDIAWQRIVNGLYGSRIRISDAQIDETYNRLAANVSKPSYRVAEIYIEASPDIGGMDGANEGANAMIQQAQQGAPFSLLAQQFSSAPSAAKGGDIGWVRQGELRSELDNALQNLEPGNLSQPIQVPGGYYVLALIDKQISESEAVFKLKRINIAINEDRDAEAARSTLIEASQSLSSCDDLAQDVKQYDGVKQADMGELKASEISDPILEKLNATRVGEFTEPFETASSLTAVLICDRQESSSNLPTRDEIENRLMNQQLALASKRHLRDLRRKASIIIR